MLIRIRLRHGPAIDRTPNQYQPAGNSESKDPNKISLDELAGGLAELLTPAALIAAVLAAWRLGADLHVAGPFFIENGVLSHYQTWLVIAAALQMNVTYLKKKAARAAEPQS